jgi:predicted 3-demethylubiquinone-9 3-methyltransferase (glyoxalase superfamily)
MQKIIPNLWFDKEAEEAVNFYVSIFKDSKIGDVSRYGDVGFDVHHMPAGTVMTVEFELNGQTFLALNGGPIFKFNEAVSFVINCDSQEEIDYYWEKLSEGGDVAAQQCGWLKDKYGLSWQVVPSNMGEALSGPNADKLMDAFLKMKKIDMNVLDEISKS